MTVVCPECASVFRVDPAKVPVTGVRARCSVCGGVISIPGGALRVSVTPPGGLPQVSPVRQTSNAQPAASASLPQRTPPVAPAVPAAATSPAPSSYGSSLPTPSTSMKTVARLTPASVPVTRADAGAPGHVSTPAQSAGAVSTAPGSHSASRKPINPFLKADPQERARRLARALVSDLVAYHPQKREAGLRDGNLRQLFREEIKKSYEEFLEQVGPDAAEGSSHFQDALNDILAGGRRIF